MEHSHASCLNAQTPGGDPIERREGFGDQPVRIHRWIALVAKQKASYSKKNSFGACAEPRAGAIDPIDHNGHFGRIPLSFGQKIATRILCPSRAVLLDFACFFFRLAGTFPI